MRITTWNINSVRLRIGLALKLLDQSRPDVLCLQETKCPDEQFPFEAFRDIGYKYIAVNGMKFTTFMSPQAAMSPILRETINLLTNSIS